MKSTCNRSIEVTTRSYNKRKNCEPSNRELAERFKTVLRIRSFDTAFERNRDGGDDNSLNYQFSNMSVKNQAERVS